MSFILSNSIWIAMAGLIAIPLIVHLFARNKPPKHQFSDIRFLRNIIKKSARYKKPQDWLILLLRTLAITLLVLAFLQLIAINKNESSSDKSNVVYIIDRSSSMQATNGSISHFEVATQKVSQLIKSTNADQTNIVWMDSSPNAVFPQLGSNKQFLQQALNTTSPSSEIASIQQSIQIATNQLYASSGKKKIIILSDFQENAWANADIDIPADIVVERIAINSDEKHNSSVHSIRCTPEIPVVGQSADISLTVSNFSPKKRSHQVYIDFAGGRTVKEVEVPAWGNTDIIHQVIVPSPGQTLVKCSIDSDSFPTDDSTQAVLEVRETLSIGVFGEQIPLSLEKLSQAIDWLTVRKIDSLNEPVDYLFLLNWDGSNASELKSQIEQGKIAWVQLKPNTPKSAIYQIIHPSHADQTGAFTEERSQDLKDAWQVYISNKDYRGVDIFTSGEFGSPASGKHLRRLDTTIEGIPTANTTEILKYNDNKPALIRYTLENTEQSGSRGSLHLSSMRFSPEEQWTQSSSFLPFIAEWLLAERHSATSTRPNAYDSGSSITWIANGKIDTSAVTLLDEKDQNHSISQNQTHRGLQFSSDSELEPGLYKWKASNSTAHISAINHPSTESDLRTMAPENVKIGDLVTSKQLIRRASLGDGWNLWPWCVLALLCLLILELYVATWKLKN